MDDKEANELYDMTFEYLESFDYSDVSIIIDILEKWRSSSSCEEVAKYLNENNIDFEEYNRQANIFETQIRDSNAEVNEDYEQTQLNRIAARASVCARIVMTAEGMKGKDGPDGDEPTVPVPDPANDGPITGSGANILTVEEGLPNAQKGQQIPPQ